MTLVLPPVEGTCSTKKVMVVDGLWSSIGSANFDDRSLEINGETQFGVVDAKIAQSLKEVWDEDLRFTRRIDLAAWRERGHWHRLVDRLAYMLNEQF